MDNLAHTLVGAALGRAVADRKVPAAGWIGAIAGNAPDWSELLVSPGTWGGAPGSAPAYLVYHRGITHSFVGAVIEIVVLTGLVGLILTWRTRADADARPPWRWIAVCIAAAVASHLYLDWQGPYGLRPFLPWSGRWGGRGPGWSRRARAAGPCPFWPRARRGRRPRGWAAPPCGSPPRGRPTPPGPPGGPFPPTRTRRPPGGRSPLRAAARSRSS